MTYLITESCVDLMDRSCVDVGGATLTGPVGTDTAMVAALPPKG